MTGRSSRLRSLVWRARFGLVGLVVFMLLGILPSVGVPSSAAGSQGLAAPLPSPMIGVYGQQLRESEGEVFFNRNTDLNIMTEAFNTVIVGAGKFMHGDPSVVQAIGNKGMASILIFDWSHRWLEGDDISRDVDRVIEAVQENPGMIAGIDVADELNSDPTRELLTLNQMIGYLEATAGRFHDEIPGVPIFADIVNSQLSCGLPQQGSCDLSTRSCWPDCRYQTNNVMTAIYDTGLLDGMFLSYPNWFDRADVGEVAMQRARDLLPQPFKIFADTGTLSFWENTFPGTAADADAKVNAWRVSTLEGGADGASLWVWRKNDWQGRFRTLRDKDGSGNALWNKLVASFPGNPPPPPTSTTSTTTTAVPPPPPPPPSGVKCFGRTATIVGTNGDDVLTGTPGDDVIHALGGNDVVRALDGNDVVCGGDGNDLIIGGRGHDFILGDLGNDTLRGKRGKDAITGGLGHDTINGGKARDVIVGHSGNDTMRGSSGDDLIFGSDGSSDLAIGGADLDYCQAETAQQCDGLQGPWQLKATGIGAIDFGTGTNAAIEEFSRLGQSDENSGWVNASGPYGSCPGTQVRMVRWGNLRTFYTRSGTGQGTFFAWDVTTTVNSLKLPTPTGLRFNDTHAQIELRYSNMTRSGKDFYVNGDPDGISGTLENTSLGAKITHLQGGPGCS